MPTEALGAIKEQAMLGPKVQVRLAMVQTNMPLELRRYNAVCSECCANAQNIHPYPIHMNLYAPQAPQI